MLPMTGSAGGGASDAAPTGVLAVLEESLARRADVNERFYAAEAERIARLCHRMAERFARGGRLVAFGASPAAASDARHVAVEFVHPVIVGKRALPAFALTREAGSLVSQAGLALEPDDIAIAFADEDAGAEPDTRAAVITARERGCLSIAFSRLDAEWEFAPPTGDRFIRQELIEILYHLLWELVHVFFEHRGLLEGRRPQSLHDAGASSFLYPFLAEQEQDLNAVLAEVSRSVRLKVQEASELRAQTIGGAREELIAAATTLRRVFDARGSLLVLGNGGSATDAMDVVADFRSPPQGWTARRALDLTADAAILTAIANDIGTDALFARQVIAYGRHGDAVLALSTSGNSRNVIQALEEARRRGLRTIALVGYDGGRVASDGLAEHVIVSPSQHIPRIQEAQATAYHLLRELVEFTKA
jgi:D-sedoheptulose 7-phosphate isomerase